MGDKLNDLSKSEIDELRARIKVKNLREERACEHCGIVRHMRPDQKYCSSACRTKAHNERLMLSYEKLVVEKEEWEKERAELHAEIAHLRGKING